MAQPSCIRAIQPLQQPWGLRLGPPLGPTLGPTPGPTPTGTHYWDHYRYRPGPTTGTHYRDSSGTHSRRTHACGTHAVGLMPGPMPGAISPGPTSGPTLGPTTGPILEAHDPLPAPLPVIEPPLQSQDQHLDPLPNSPRTPSKSFPSSTLGLLVSDILGLLWSNHYMKLARVSQSHYHNYPAGDQLKSQQHDHPG
jgi:hypothetical protein